MAAIQKKGYRDLAQSVRASNATEEAAWLSYLQTRAAIVGAAFVVLTLAATAWAAWAAADAARIADKSAAAAIKAADAAEAAVAVASKTAERQLRAYISIDLDTERKPKVNTDLIEIDFKVTNRGQTPAYGMFHWNRVQIRPFPESGPLRRDRGGKLLYGRTDVASGAKFGITAYYGQGIGVEELIALQKGQKRIYLFGAIYFRDAFERRRYLRYCYTLRVNQDGSIPGPELYHRHNESN
jgi:hypothetical protein